MKTIDQRVTKARSSLIMGHPFFGALALYLQIKEDETIQDMETDGRTLSYAPSFLDKVTEKELEAVIARCVTCCAYSYMTRRGNRDSQLWNDACHYSVNRDLERAGFRLPQGSLTDPRFDRMSAEEIFACLKREKEQAQKPQGSSQGGGNGSQGSGMPQSSQGPSQGPQNGNGGPSDIGRAGKIKDAAKPGSGQAAGIEGEWKIYVRQAMAVEKAKGCGNIPAELQRMFDEIKRPLVDWRETLRRFIDDRTRIEFSWTKPNKRMLGAGYVIPGIVPDGLNQIGIVIDTSGSIDKESLSRFMSEVQAAMDDGATKRVIIISCDTMVKSPAEFELGDQIKYQPVGGGGTRFAPAIDWFVRKHPDIAALIYFTDLDCSDFGEEPWIPLLWIAHGPANVIRDRTTGVPFGEVVPLVD